jgi:hypothetical protein
MTKRLFFLLFLITNTLQMAKGAYAAGGEMKVSHIGNNKYWLRSLPINPAAV